MSDLFNGAWKLNHERSKVWDSALERWIPDPVGREDVVQIDGEVHDYENIVGLSPIYTIGYTARYNDTTWVPYMVRAIDNVPEETPETDMAGELGYTMKLGEPLSYVMLVRITDGYHYRISKNLDGTPGYVMPRQMADDGQSFTTTVLWADGTVKMIKVFDRE